MIEPQQYQPADTLKDMVSQTQRSSSAVLDAIKQSEKLFRRYNDNAKWIDKLYGDQVKNVSMIAQLDLSDNEYDLFWASVEILKPAIYAKPPVVVSKPRFSDSGKSEKVAAELIERVVNSEFERSDIDLVMLGVRDDLAILNRGVAWVTLEEKNGRKGVCVEHLDREDFLHDPARKWSDVGWVARRAWMTRKEMADRFRATSGEAYQDADFEVLKQDRRNGAADDSLKAAVWEVWSKVDNRVYWVSPGVDVMLDEDKPHLNLSNFFPCPRPAYGTTQRRSLVPVPDYRRYARHLDQINALTLRIYDLLREVKLRGLLPAGGDVGIALETAISENTSAMFIPVPAAALMASGGSANLVQFLPLQELAATITGLIEARNQLFNDFFQLSGISDIMRGATDAQETYGAQRLKSQYGSIRVRDKIDEIVRLARDSARISVEIIADNFSRDLLLEISQMEIPTRAEMEKALASVQESAKAELDQLGEKAAEIAQQEDAQQQLQQAQQQIIAKYAPQIEQIRNTVVIEDVMGLITDERARSIAIDIETDSTVMVDEAQEKQSRAEFLAAFANASGAIQGLIQMGEDGAKLAGAMLKFSLQPYNVSRELAAMIDDFIENAPQMAQRLAEQGGESEELVAAQKQLAEAEKAKADAAMASVQARAAQAQADNERKIAELQQRAQNDAQKAQQEANKLRLQLADMAQKGDKQSAEIDKLRAQTAEILNKIGLDVRKQELSEYQASEQSEARRVDQAMTAENADRETRFREQDRADRQMERGE